VTFANAERAGILVVTAVARLDVLGPAREDGIAENNVDLRLKIVARALPCPLTSPLQPDS